MLERSISNSLQVVDRNICRQSYYLEQLRTSHGELLSKIVPGPRDLNIALESPLGNRVLRVLNELQLQPLEREAFWEQVNQLLLSLNSQANRLSAGASPANGRTMTAPSE